MKLPSMGTLGRIDLALINLRVYKEKKFLSCSMLGDDCDRKTWFEFYHPKKIDDPVLLRKFDMGDLVEAYIVKLLRMSGHIVHNLDENGKQFEVVFGNYLTGHVDGIIEDLEESGAPHLLEIKSACNSSFNQMKKLGINQSQPRYYVQVQTYMMGLDLKRCLFIVMNKDSQELYIERIKYDEFVAKSALEKAQMIYDNQNVTPDRFYSKSTHYKCGMCRYKKECWNEN